MTPTLLRVAAPKTLPCHVCRALCSSSALQQPPTSPPDNPRSSLPILPSFRPLKLPSELLQALDTHHPEITSPTPFQLQSIPQLLKTLQNSPTATPKPHCTLLTSPPNTGKTLSYLLPILTNLSHHVYNYGPASLPGRPSCLILVPTRELAEQTLSVVTPLAKAVGCRSLPAYGGVGLGTLKSIHARKSSNVVVGTPGVVDKLLKSKALLLSRCGNIVVDEADVMMDVNEGFVEECLGVLGEEGNKRLDVEWVYVAATVTKGLLDVLEKRHGGRQGVKVFRGEGVGSLAVGDGVGVRFVEFGGGIHKRLEALVNVVRLAYCQIGKNRKVMVFCNSSDSCDTAFEALEKEFDKAVCISGNMDKKERESQWEEAQKKSTRIIVCTDVVGRGVDVKDVGASVMLETPDYWAKYVHRAGRLRGMITTTTHSTHGGGEGVVRVLVSAREKERALNLYEMIERDREDRARSGSDRESRLEWIEVGKRARSYREGRYENRRHTNMSARRVDVRKGYIRNPSRRPPNRRQGVFRLRSDERHFQHNRSR